MKAHDLIGRRIVAVKQQRVSSQVGPSTQLRFIELDNGVRIGFTVDYEASNGEAFVRGLRVKLHRCPEATA
jgi:hypothetical protein